MPSVPDTLGCKPDRFHFDDALAELVDELVAVNGPVDKAAVTRSAKEWR